MKREPWHARVGAEHVWREYVATLRINSMRSVIRVQGADARSATDIKRQWRTKHRLRAGDASTIVAVVENKTEWTD